MTDPETDSSQKNTVLVAEDNDFVRAQIAGYLKAMGHKVLQASEGTAALEHMDADPDIVLAIVDVRMEPMGGLEFVKAIRGRDIETAVILVTGDQMPDLLEQASAWGVSAVLMKPVEKNRLTLTVKKTIEASKRLSR